MAINLNTNFGIFAPNPIDDRYLSERTSGGTQLPYSANTEVFATITQSRRYEGLTVLIQSGTTPTEYWFKEGIIDGDLIEKKYASEQLVGDFVTGATNLGYFSGQTGVQELDLASGFGTTYNGSYYSEYQNYLVDSGNVLRIDVDGIDGVLRRGYVRADRNYSWVFNESTNTWIIIDGDVVEEVGNDVGIILFTSTYEEETWIDGTTPQSGGTSINVYGSLNTGTTITVGAPPYSYFENSNLYFRTIKSSTPNLINVGYVDDFITISGASGAGGVTGATNGLTLNGEDISLGGTISSATTLTLSGASASLTITDIRTTPTGIQYGDDYSNTYTARSLVDAGYVTGLTSAGSLVKNVCNPIVSSYGTVSTDFYIGTSGGTTVSLSGVKNNGQIIVVSDIVGNACGSLSCSIEIDAGGDGTTFVGGSVISCIDTPFGSMTYLYNSEINKWVVIGFSSTPA